MKIDYISDLHLDFYVASSGNWRLKLDRFLQTLLPQELGDVLIIAGDLSHYNAQSFSTLQFFSNLYKQVFFVLGNHDYYLVSWQQESKYHYKSVEREYELVQMISALPNVKLLSQFEPFIYEGITFAGSTNWYGLKTIDEQLFFNNRSNDSVLIKGLDIPLTHQKEMEAYGQLRQIDVLITHVPPIMPKGRLQRSSPCYVNELPNLSSKVCIFGHTHVQIVDERENTTFCSNALGYPDEYLPRKIQSIQRTF